MAVKLGALVKMMTGGFDKEQLAELLTSIGVEASLVPIEKRHERVMFQALWSESELGGEVLILKAKMKNGATLSGILVSTEPSNNSGLSTGVTKGTKESS